MQQMMTTFDIPTRGKGLYEFTDEAARWIERGSIDAGLLTLFCRHTSASLLINENAAPAVKRDLLRWLERAAPEGTGYEHDDEGSDDMPAHIRAMLTGSSLSVPVQGRRMLLGTWQGLYLAEHRAAVHTRSVVAHLLGE
jgi:secondary thiamine-phosphate synthase enzyme